MDQNNNLSQRTETSRNRELYSGNAPSTRYPELLHSLLASVSRDYAQGNLRRIRRYGLTTHQAEQIAAMSAHDLHALSMNESALFRIKVDTGALDEMIERLNLDDKEDRLLDRLLMLDAPAQMMQQLFGLSAAECATRRKVLGITASTGRPRAPSEAEEQAIWTAWRGSMGLSGPQRLETVAAETDLPLNMIWAQLRRWEKEGSDPDRSAYVEPATTVDTPSPQQTPHTATTDTSSWKSRLRARLLHRPDSEGAQTLIRLFVSFLLVCYGITVAPMDEYLAGLGPDALSTLVAGVSVMLVWPIAQLAWLIADPRTNRVRRFAGLLYDVATLTWFLMFLGQFGGLMYMIYLWIIIGHGLRFGVSNLVAATLFSMTGFSLVLAFNGFWQTHLALGIGLFTGLAAVPLYTYSLIRAMTRSKLRAHQSRLATLPVGTHHPDQPES